MISMFLVVKECFIPHPRLPDLIGIQKQVLMLGYCILRTFVSVSAMLVDTRQKKYRSSFYS